MPLTEKQQKILDFIIKFSQKNSYAPSQREIATHFGFSSLGTVQDYLKLLEERGYLEKSFYSRRNLTIVQKERNLPLLGKVAAGRPIDYSIHDRSIEVPSTMLKGTKEHFALEVSGDSMIDAGILDGDIVVVRKQDEAANGEVVVAMVNQEATIKRLHKKKDRVELHSENSKYKPILVQTSDEFRIVGILAGLLRVT